MWRLILKALVKNTISIRAGSYYVGDAAGADKPDFDDSGWKSVTLPHAWNEDDAFQKDIHDLSTGIAWYRKHFSLPASSENKKIFLEFEGIRQAGDFYLNGKLIGRSENGVMAFGFDITDSVRRGDNVIAARIDNSWDYKEKATGSAFEWNDRNFYANYGGINKNVYLHITDKLYQTLPLYSDLQTTGVYIYPTDIDIKNRTAIITAETQVKNEYPIAKTFEYEVTINDATGRACREHSMAGSTRLPRMKLGLLRLHKKSTGLNFWSWGYGYLYDVFTTTESRRQGHRHRKNANRISKNRICERDVQAERSDDAGTRLRAANDERMARTRYQRPAVDVGS